MTLAAGTPEDPIIEEWVRVMARDGRKVHTVYSGSARTICGVRVARRVPNATPHTCDRCFDKTMGTRVFEGLTFVHRWKYDL